MRKCRCGEYMDATRTNLELRNERRSGDTIVRDEYIVVSWRCKNGHSETSETFQRTRTDRVN